MKNPLSQFAIHKVIPMSFLGYDISLTNSSISMLCATTIACLLLAFCLRKITIIPSEAQIFAEKIYNVVNGTLINSAGPHSEKYMPFIFSLFLFILSCNLLGMLPYSFTATSHIIITFSLASMVFIFITLVGFIKHGLKFLSLFLPSGIPILMAPLMIIIELFTYLGRPVSLSLRLVANMVAGHVLLKVLAGFMVMLPLMGKFLPVPVMVVMIAFEFGVAILQAYIFTILSCVYLNDTLNLH